MVRRYSGMVAVYVRHRHWGGAYGCTIKTPDGQRFLRVHPPASNRLSEDSTELLSEIAKSAINFAVDEDERRLPAYRGGDDISVSEYMELDEHGELVVYVKRRDAYGGFYITSYCNRAHEIHTGKPIDHDCNTLPPEAIHAERRGDTGRANQLLADMSSGDGMDHYVVALDDAGTPIENVKFRLWSPDGPWRLHTIDRSVAQEVCGRLANKHRKTVANPKGTWKGSVLGGFEVVSEQR